MYAFHYETHIHIIQIVLCLQVLIEFIVGGEHEYLVNNVDRCGDSPLHVAAQHGNLPIVRVNIHLIGFTRNCVIKN